jgi:tRNA threonylcarbamoyladenosine biosynthesis protein TsaE
LIREGLPFGKAAENPSQSGRSTKERLYRALTFAHKKGSGVRKYRTGSDAETVELGRQLARELPPRGVVLLIGNLGAGKTTLAKGIAAGLGAAEADEVSSPTFTLIHEYGGGRVYHVDLYRLDERRAVESLGLDDLFERDAVTLIEWGERFAELMPARRTEIRIRALPEDGREFEVEET